MGITLVLFFCKDARYGDGMRIKKYTAPTMRLALEQMRKELGDEAVILSNRVISGEGEDTVTEVVAGIEPKDLQRHLERSVTPPVEITQAAGEQIQIKKHDFAANSAPIQKNTITHKHNSAGMQTEVVSTAATLLAIKEELQQLRGTVNEINESTRYKYSGSLPQLYRKVYQELRNADFNEEQAIFYVGRLAAKSVHANLSEIKDDIEQLFAQHFKCSSFLPMQNGEPTIAAFVGATGAGKTSSLVKLAIAHKIANRSDVLIVSADTYKIGGAEQLQTYCMIANIPYKTVNSPAELRHLLLEESHRDLILIDTVGRSHRDENHLHDIQMYLQAVSPHETYLTLPATLGEQVFTDCLQQYSKLQPTGLVLTKLDESPYIGGILQALRKQLIPISYISSGQKIPDDIEVATIYKLLRFIMPGI